jgi:hypothetical protein
MTLPLSALKALLDNDFSNIFFLNLIMPLSELEYFFGFVHPLIPGNHI